MISTCGAPREPSFTLIVFSMTVSIIPGLALSVVSQKADPKIRKTTCPPPEPFAARTNYQDSAALRRVEIERVLQRATEAAQQGRLREALEVLNSVSSSADLLPAYFHLRGTLEARTNQLELAEKDLRKALILAPRLSDAMYTLGLIELQQAIALCCRGPAWQRVQGRLLALNGRRGLGRSIAASGRRPARGPRRPADRA